MVVIVALNRSFLLAGETHKAVVGGCAPDPLPRVRHPERTGTGIDLLVSGRNDAGPFPEPSGPHTDELGSAGDGVGPDLLDRSHRLARSVQHPVAEQLPDGCSCRSSDLLDDGSRDGHLAVALSTVRVHRAILS